MASSVTPAAGCHSRSHEPTSPNSSAPLDSGCRTSDYAAPARQAPPHAVAPAHAWRQLPASPAQRPVGCINPKTLRSGRPPPPAPPFILRGAGQGMTNLFARRAGRGTRTRGPWSPTGGPIVVGHEPPSLALTLRQATGQRLDRRLWRGLRSLPRAAGFALRPPPPVD
jgi:hypothetical protein